MSAAADDEAVLLLPSEAAQVQRARAFVRDRLEVWGLSEPAIGDIVVVASELITNAIKYAPAKAEIALARVSSTIRLEVRDDERASPVLPVEDDTGAIPGGRGLRIVAALASRWGVDVHDGGKTVWTEFDEQAQAAAS